LPTTLRDSTILTRRSSLTWSEKGPPVLKRPLIVLFVAMATTFGASALAAGTASAAPAPAASPAIALAGTSCYPGSASKPSTCSPKSGQSSQGNGSTPTNTPTPTPTPVPATTAVLAFTGADVVVTLAVASLLVGMGLVLVRLSRRRSAA
jgi:hypothetical protein